MSSNFTVKRLGEQCGQVFEARITVTRFCSKLCNKRSHKQKIRNSKMASMDQVVKRVLDKGKPDLKGVEFLSVKAAAALLGASDKIVYSLIHSGKLNAINLSKRKTIVSRLRSELAKSGNLLNVLLRHVRNWIIQKTY